MMSFVMGCILIWLALVVFTSDGNPKKWSHAEGVRSDKYTGPVFLVASIVLLGFGVWLIR